MIFGLPESVEPYNFAMVEFSYGLLLPHDKDSLLPLAPLHSGWCRNAEQKKRELRMQKSKGPTICQRASQHTIQKLGLSPGYLRCIPRHMPRISTVARGWSVGVSSPS